MSRKFGKGSSDLPRKVVSANLQPRAFQLKDASVGGKGLQAAFRDADWAAYREAIYTGRGG